MPKYGVVEIREARLSERFFHSKELLGVVHSKFQHAINLQFDLTNYRKTLITVLAPNVMGVPDSITVTQNIFVKLTELSAGAEVWYSESTLRFLTGISALRCAPDCLRRSEFHMPSGNKSDCLRGLKKAHSRLEYYCNALYPQSGFESFSVVRQENIKHGLSEFARAWLIHDTQAMEISLLRYIGMGIGLTPSCDDAFLGIIALYEGARLYVNLTGVSLPLFSDLLQGRTTDVSMKYLCCAQEGRFSDVVVKLVEEVFSYPQSALELQIESVSSVGGSSGIDTLIGMTIACRELIRVL